MDKNQIALIELGGSHEECLYSQVLFLKKYKYEVCIIILKDHFDRIEKWPEVDHWLTYPKPTSGIGEWRLRRSTGYLRSKGKSAVVIVASQAESILHITHPGFEKRRASVSCKATESGDSGPVVGIAQFHQPIPMIRTVDTACCCVSFHMTNTTIVS